MSGEGRREPATGRRITEVNLIGHKSLWAAKACMNRKYMNHKFVAVEPQCSGCASEKCDLFHGTTGWSFWGWYCSFKPE